MLMVNNKNNIVISSPDKNIKCRLFQKSKSLYYEISYNNRIIIENSKLGFLIHGEKSLDSFLIKDVQKETNLEKIEMPWGDTRYIDNSYNEINLNLSSTNHKESVIKITFRIFNNAVAFRYEIQKMNHKKQKMPKKRINQKKIIIIKL